MIYVYSVKLGRKTRYDRGLGRIYGCDQTRLKKMLYMIQCSPRARVSTMELKNLESVLNYLRSFNDLGPDGRQLMRENIRRHIKINSYRGFRLSGGYPCRGQRTHTNAKTCRHGGRKSKKKHTLTVLKKKQRILSAKEKAKLKSRARKHKKK